ncbi:hypothetical protein FB451DRAFT_1186948 [Mycena latifolia]|nr:hypothetical protein FB451DRAFT_1186948 [Mycena latifolia]
MISSPSVALLAFALSAAARLQIESFNNGFFNAGIQGCISAASNADGAPVVIHDCNTEDTANHDWEVSFFTRQAAGPQQITVFGDKPLGERLGTGIKVFKVSQALNRLETGSHSS